jgi:hypothetical protein
MYNLRRLRAGKNDLGLKVKRPLSNTLLVLRAEVKLSTPNNHAHFLNLGLFAGHVGS